MNALIQVECVGPVGVPRTVADVAVAKVKEIRRQRRRDGSGSFEKNDQVWAVFDRDEHPYFDDAIALCESRGVRVARSNPCFEVWLILHEEDYHAPGNRHEVQSFYRQLRPEYDPHTGKVPDCADVIFRIEDAERRAERQLCFRRNEGDPFGRPSTTVGDLTKAIREAAKASAPR